MKIYLAARYSRREEVCGYRDQLVEMGHEVTSRWLLGDHQIGDDGLKIGADIETQFEAGSDAAHIVALRTRFAEQDMADLRAASVCISFTEAPRSGHSRGGRHVEFGVALERGIVLLVVGHRENVFHCLPNVLFYPDWAACLIDIRNYLVL